MNADDSEAFKTKQNKLKRVLTIYGRKPVLEALENNEIIASKLHLSESNKSAKILTDIQSLALHKQAEIVYHDRLSLSRISKNGKQDQGVALDIVCKGFQSLSDFLKLPPVKFSLIALDGITNPQNLGMIIRSVCASPCTGLLLPNKGCAKLDSLVIKASAGTLFKANIIRCDTINDAIKQLKGINTSVFALDGSGSEDWSQCDETDRQLFVMGNESDGVSSYVIQNCQQCLRIPMAGGVESLNVAVAASLVAFRRVF